MTALRSLVLTPAIDGADGISALGRQIVTSLASTVDPKSIEVWTLDGGRPDEFPPSVTVWSARGSRSRIVRRTVSAAARGCAQLDVLALHLHLAPLAMLLGGRGARVIDFLIGIEAWTQVRPRERRALAQADRIVAISDFTVREFRRANPALASLPVVTCAPGIASPAARVAGADDGYALIVGRLSSMERYKGHDALIEVWPRVLRSAPAAKLLVVGDGDDRQRLESAVDVAGLSASISFTGRVDDRALADLYARASFFVMPSAREGFGLVYLEAMRAGKPCIAAHGSADEILRHDVDGLVIDGTSREELADAIVRLFSNPTDRARMGSAALKRMQQHFSDEQFTLRLLRAIDRVRPVASNSVQEIFS
jgi:glycosyltransferase involved in cell wall biosynthesis